MHRSIRTRGAPSAKVTLEKVAERAGVSPSTVSRILNGTAVVGDEKRAAVDEAVAKLGFVPNPVARGLAGGRTLSIGVVSQAIDSPFYGAASRPRRSPQRTTRWRCRPSAWCRTARRAASPSLRR